MFSFYTCFPTFSYPIVQTTGVRKHRLLCTYWCIGVYFTLRCRGLSVAQIKVFKYFVQRALCNLFVCARLFDIRFRINYFVKIVTYYKQCQFQFSIRFRAFYPSRSILYGQIDDVRLRNDDTFTFQFVNILINLKIFK